MVALGCVLFTLLFGYLLSVGVNLSLEAFETQVEQMVPGAGMGNPSQ